MKLVVGLLVTMAVLTGCAPTHAKRYRLRFNMLNVPPGCPTEFSCAGGRVVGFDAKTKAAIIQCP